MHGCYAEIENGRIIAQEDRLNRCERLYDTEVTCEGSGKVRTLSEDVSPLPNPLYHLRFEPDTSILLAVDLHP
jgi:hypothetical protein